MFLISLTDSVVLLNDLLSVCVSQCCLIVPTCHEIEEYLRERAENLWCGENLDYFSVTYVFVHNQ